MSKGGGQTQTSTTEMPQWMQEAAQENLNRARHASTIGFVPNYGLDVAAFSPMQQQAMQNTVGGAQSFGMAPEGMDAMAGMPQATTQGGFTGYSSGDLYDESLAQLAERRPGQYGMQQAMFVDPVTGQLAVNFTPQGANINTNVGMSAPFASLQGGGDSGSGGVDTGGDSGASGGAFTGSSRLITNPILTGLGSRYNEMGILGRVLNPLGTAAGFLADKAIYNAGGEYNDDHELYLQRGDIMLGRGEIDPTQAYQGYVEQMNAQQAEIERQEQIAQQQAAAQAAEAARRAAAQQMAAQAASQSSGGSDYSYNSGGSDFSNSSYNAGGGVSTSGGNLGGGYVHGGW